MVGMLTSKDVTRQVFTQTSMRRGYDEREVDDFLDEVIETLRYYEQGGRPAPQAPEAPARLESGGISQRASRWLRGDPEQ
jgi:DivIVA domain-containing protein